VRDHVEPRWTALGRVDEEVDPCRHGDQPRNCAHEETEDSHTEPVLRLPRGSCSEGFLVGGLVYRRPAGSTQACESPAAVFV